MLVRSFVSLVSLVVVDGEWEWEWEWRGFASGLVIPIAPRFFGGVI